MGRFISSTDIPKVGFSRSRIVFRAMLLGGILFVLLNAGGCGVRGVAPRARARDLTPEQMVEYNDIVMLATLIRVDTLSVVGSCHWYPETDTATYTLLSFTYHPERIIKGDSGLTSVALWIVARDIEPGGRHRGPVMQVGAEVLVYGAPLCPFPSLERTGFGNNAEVPEYKKRLESGDTAATSPCSVMRYQRLKALQPLLDSACADSTTPLLIYSWDVDYFDQVDYHRGILCYPWFSDKLGLAISSQRYLSQMLDAAR